MTELEIENMFEDNRIEVLEWYYKFVLTNLIEDNEEFFREKVSVLGGKDKTVELLSRMLAQLSNPANELINQTNSLCCYTKVDGAVTIAMSALRGKYNHSLPVLT